MGSYQSIPQVDDPQLLGWQGGQGPETADSPKKLHLMKKINSMQIKHETTGQHERFQSAQMLLAQAALNSQKGPGTFFDPNKKTASLNEFNANQSSKASANSKSPMNMGDLAQIVKNQASLPPAQYLEARAQTHSFGGAQSQTSVTNIGPFQGQLEPAANTTSHNKRRLKKLIAEEEDEEMKVDDMKFEDEFD